MAAASGVYSWAGFNSNLVKARHLTMTALSGAFAWTGFNANLTAQQFTGLTAPVIFGGNLAGFNYGDMPNALVNMQQQGYSDPTGSGRDWQTLSNGLLVADANGDPPTDFQCTPHRILNPNNAQQDCAADFGGWVDTITTDNAHVTIVGKAYAGNTTTFTVRFDATWPGGSNYHLIFTGTRRSGGSGGTPNTGGIAPRIAHPGYTLADITGKVWTDEYVNYVKVNFPHCLRMMDAELINGNQSVNWTDVGVRRRATHKTGGPTIEDLCDIANRAMVPPMFQFQHLFTDVAKQAKADLIESRVNPALAIYAGISNEKWNPSFQQNHDILKLACVELKAFVATEGNRSFSATRTANVVTVTTVDDHLLVGSPTVYFVGFDGLASLTQVVNVTGAKTFTFTLAGADGAIRRDAGHALDTSSWFIGALDTGTSLRLGTTLAADTNLNIYQYGNRWGMRSTKELSDLIRTRPTIGDAKMGTRWRITFEDQMVNNSGDEPFSDPPLRYLKNKFTARAVKEYLYIYMGAPYFFADPYQNTAGATQAQIVGALQLNCSLAKSQYKFQERIAVSRYYGIRSGWYEGGTDTTSGLSGADLAVRSAAQFDPGLQTPVQTMLADHYRPGGDLAVWYNTGLALATDQNAFTSWAVTNSVTNNATPKLLAFAAVRAAPPAMTVNLIPAVIDGRDYCDQYVRGGYANLTVDHRRFLITAPVTGTYRVIVGYTCNFGGDAANIIVNETTVSAGPFTFVNQGTGISHNTLRASPGPIFLKAFAANLLQGSNAFDFARTANMGDDVEIFSIDVKQTISLQALSGLFAMVGNAVNLTKSTPPPPPPPPPPPASSSALEADWARRNTWPLAAGGVNDKVTYKTDFREAEAWTHADQTGGHLFVGNMDAGNLAARLLRDFTTKITGDSCLKIRTPADVGTNSAAWQASWDPTRFTDLTKGLPLNTKFFVYFAIMVPTNRLLHSNTQRVKTDELHTVGEDISSVVRASVLNVEQWTWDADGGVKRASDNAVYTKVASNPVGLQYVLTFNGPIGIYTFNASQQGVQVKVSYHYSAQLGWKFANFAGYSPIQPYNLSRSNIGSEVVLQDSDQLGVWQGYHRDDQGQYMPFNAAMGGHITKQQIDNGPGLTDPNRYCYYSGGPTSGCYPILGNQWYHFECEFLWRAYNSATGLDFVGRVMKPGDTVWTELIRGIQTGTGNPNDSGLGYTANNGTHLIGYETQRLPGTNIDNGDTSQDTHIWYSQYMSSYRRTPIPFYERTGSPLAALANSMAPGTWAQLTSVSNLSEALKEPLGTDGTIINYTNSMPWNPRNHTIEIVAGDHIGASDNMKHVRYDEQANRFDVVQGIPVVVGEAGHGYEHTAVNPYTGDVYHRRYDSFEVYVKPYGASTFNTMLPLWNAHGFPQQASIACCWWSGPFAGAGSQGCFLIANPYYSGGGNIGQIVGYDPISQTWFYEMLNANAGETLIQARSNVIVYSPAKNVAVYGGGVDSPRKIWRLNEDGTRTPMADAPIGTEVGPYQGIFECDPITGNFLLLSNGQLWEFNPDGATGTWTLQTGTRVPPSGVGIPGPTTHIAVMACAMPEHGVIGYVTKNSLGDAGTFYLYKHAGVSSFYTDFTGTESPLSEGGAWSNPASSVWNNPVSKQNGMAVGLNSSGNNDSIAQLGGVWPADQEITGVVKVNGAFGPAEVELHLRMSFPSSSAIRTVEVDIVQSLNLVQLVDWNGTINQFTAFANFTLNHTLASGDIFRARVVGSTYTVWLTPVSTGVEGLIGTTTYAAGPVTGNPGIGFDAGSPASGANLGWDSISAIGL